MTNFVKAWSFSRLSLWEKCPKLFKFRVIDKRPEPKAPAMHRGIKIHNEAAKFLSRKTKVFPPSCINFEDQFRELLDLNPIVEQRWAFTSSWQSVGWFHKRVHLRVVLDVGLLYGDGHAEVIDHKTGKRYDDDYIDQLGLFAGATMMMFPKEVETVTARLWYLDSGEEIIEEFSKTRAMAVLADLEKRAYKMMSAQNFPPRPNWSCKWCHFRQSNGGPCQYG